MAVQKKPQNKRVALQGQKLIARSLNRCKVSVGLRREGKKRENKNFLADLYSDPRNILLTPRSELKPSALNTAFLAGEVIHVQLVSVHRRRPNATITLRPRSIANRFVRQLIITRRNIPVSLRHSILVLASRHCPHTCPSAARPHCVPSPWLTRLSR